MRERKLNAVLFNHHTWSGAFTGAEKNLLHTARCLKRAGHHVRWVSPCEGGIHFFLAQEEIEVEMIPTPMLWELIHEPERVPDALQKVKAHESVQQLKRWLKKVRADVVIANSAIHVVPVWASYQAGIPTAWFWHEIVRAEPHTHPLFTFASQAADRVIVPSRAAAEGFERFSIRPHPLTLPYGVDIAWKDKTPWKSPTFAKRRNDWRTRYQANDRVWIAFMGTFQPGKGFHHFVQALERAAERGASFFPLTVGYTLDEAYRRYWEKRLPFQPPLSLPFLSDVHRIMPAADIVVIPSTVEECFPNIALEAMAAGRAIAAYRSGGLKDMLSHNRNGWLADKGDIEGLAQGIQTLISEETERRRLGVNAFQTACTRYESERYCRGLSRVLQALMSSPKN